ncbi:MAG: hypothetical protein AAF532_08895 [Planctomycetota bacterium]
MERYDDLNVPQIALVGVVSTVIVVVLILATQTLYLNYNDWLAESKLRSGGVPEPQRVLNAQRDTLTSYDKIDAETYAIPIDSAMTTTVAEMRTELGLGHDDDEHAHDKADEQAGHDADGHDEPKHDAADHDHGDHGKHDA